MKTIGRIQSGSLLGSILVLSLLGIYCFAGGTLLSAYAFPGLNPNYVLCDTSSCLDRGEFAGNCSAILEDSIAYLNNSGLDCDRQDRLMHQFPAWLVNPLASAWNQILATGMNPSGASKCYPSIQRFLSILSFIGSAEAQNDSAYRYERGRTRFVSSEVVTGIGFTNIRSQMESPDNDLLSLQEHGSGSYSSNRTTEYYSVNTSTSPDKDFDIFEVFPEHAEELFDDLSDYGYLSLKDDDLVASYGATSLPLPRLRSLNFTTRWSMATRAFSAEAVVSLLDLYRHANWMNKSTNLIVDRNDVDAEFVTNFLGAADIRYTTPVGNSLDRYTGSFRLQEDLSSGESTSSSNGIGFVDIDKVIKDEGFQRTYEHGSGQFSLEEYIDPGRNRLEKNISLKYVPVKFEVGSGSINQSREWSEGVTSRSADIGQVSEEFSHLQLLEKETKVTDLAQIQTDANFAGHAEFVAAQAENFTDIEDYTGNYSIQRTVAIMKYPRYNKPHVSVTKNINHHIDCRIISYNITVVNDGNRQLGPVYVVDTFPVGCVFLASSEVPLALTSRYANWSIEELASGESRSIDLRLRIEREVEKMTNRVRATAYYLDTSNRQLRTSSSYTSTDPLDLSNCVPPEMMLTMKADKNTTSPNIINYQLTLHNRADYNISVNLSADMPSGAEFLDSSPKPKIMGKDKITWSYKLNSGSKRTIRYRLAVPGSGLIEAKAIANADSIDGQRHLAAEAVANVIISRPQGPLETRIIDDWLPGDMYDLVAMPCSSGSCPVLWEPNLAAGLYPPVKLVPGSSGYTEELPCC